jgi:hypothetical protein
LFQIYEALDRAKEVAIENDIGPVSARGWLALCRPMGRRRFRLE